MADGWIRAKGEYIGEAKDEPSIRETYLGERKIEFHFDFITEDEVQDIADELLDQNRHVKVYYDCVLRGNPYINLLDKCYLTAPECSVSDLECQIIRIDHTLEAGKWVTTIGIVADLVQTAASQTSIIMHLDKTPADHLDAGYYIDISE